MRRSKVAELIRRLHELMIRPFGRRQELSARRRAARPGTATLRGDIWSRKPRPKGEAPLVLRSICWFAGQLGATFIETPGGHVPQVTHAPAFAEALRPLLHKLPES
jgi:hypothetical protein